MKFQYIPKNVLGLSVNFPSSSSINNPARKPKPAFESVVSISPVSDAKQAVAKTVS